VTVAHDRWPAHDGLEGCRQGEAQGLQADRNQIVKLVRDKKLDTCDQLRIGSRFNLKGAGPDVVVVNVVSSPTGMVDPVSCKVRMYPARTVMSVVMIIRVRVNQRRAQSANWNCYGERDGE